jgi:predicted N-formylglutamate amidohydrolase
MSFQTITTDGWETSRFLILCDHASPLFPLAAQRAALSEEDRVRHVVVDVGAAEVTRLLAMQLGAKAILGGYSRLLIDLNRTRDHPDLIRKTSDGTDAPFNCGLSEQEKADRVARYYEGYHAAVDAAVADLQARHGEKSWVIVVHSFTPITKLPSPQDRSCEIGVMWNMDEPSARALMDWLRASTSYKIGDNEPYSGRKGQSNTIASHLEPRGIRHTMIEIRQDLIETLPGQLRIVETLAQAFEHLA